MDFLINYYELLGVDKNATQKEIKQSYYKLSFQHHPDKGGDHKMFEIINKSYEILIDPIDRAIYDKRSKWGKNYDELSAFSDFAFKNASETWDENKVNNVIKNDILNVIHYIDDNFSGSIIYDRYIMCGKCEGSGKDFDGKIAIKDAKGKIISYVDSSDICEICDGKGSDSFGNQCPYCQGTGKIGSVKCGSCKGERRLLVKQELSGIKMKEGEDFVKIDFMGNCSKDTPGKIGSLFVIKKKK